MSLNVLFVKNAPHEGPGILTHILDEQSILYSVCDLSRGDSLPRIHNFDAFVVLGGPASANDKTPVIRREINWIRRILAEEKPYFGICLGLQLMVKSAGGRVVPAPFKEIGWNDSEGVGYIVTQTEEAVCDPLFSGIDPNFRLFQWHGETVEILKSMTLLAYGQQCRHQIVRCGKRAYGVQGHLELTESMLIEWLNAEPDLTRRDKDLLLQQANEFFPDCHRIARLLFLNFISMIEKSKKEQIAQDFLTEKSESR